MVEIVVTVHIIVCLTLCVVVLLQQGKGAEIGAVFGGSSQTVFGSSGAGNAMTRTTWTLAAIFFATSIFLALSSAQRMSGSIFQGGSHVPAAASVATPGMEGTPGAGARAPAPAKAANPAAPAKH
ncbi:MAG: preprotein translocase subunit SecG [Candidatus Binataceae bacterium]